MVNWESPAGWTLTPRWPRNSASSSHPSRAMASRLAPHGSSMFATWPAGPHGSFVIGNCRNHYPLSAFQWAPGLPPRSPPWTTAYLIKWCWFPPWELSWPMAKYGTIFSTRPGMPLPAASMTLPGPRNTVGTMAGNGPPRRRSRPSTTGRPHAGWPGGPICTIPPCQIVSPASPLQPSSSMGLRTTSPP